MTKVKSFPYEASLKAKWDTQNAFDYAIKEAAKVATKAATEKERAKAGQEKLDSAKSLKETGLLSNEQIAKSLKLPLEVVEKL
ncbi:hypothetical protein FKG96_19835 [Olivibacter sp. LS-1]|uniref:hypothetical protein n=1 Tax=Olivibacter sp. LS-1 TaxID=2592345 RepID=UPI0011EB39B3|nr:hypothetical protein [Olivibacter sp. LS-1]QEL02977.1 hypothetical protein FKG96_19835 [Olivibacter sp. LS-1]